MEKTAYRNRKVLISMTIVTVLTLLIYGLFFSVPVNAAASDQIIATHTQFPDIVYSQDVIWELTLYNQEDTDLQLVELSFTFILDNIEVETITIAANETLLARDEVTKNFTITATMPPATYDVSVSAHYKQFFGGSHTVFLIKETVSVVAIDLLSYQVNLASTPNTTKQISVYIVNRWEHELQIKEFYFKFTTASDSSTYKNATLDGQWTLYGKKWINTTVITPNNDGNYTLSIIVSYETISVVKDRTTTQHISQELQFGSLEVTSVEGTINIPHNMVIAIIAGISGVIIGALVLNLPLSIKTCVICTTTSKKTTTKFYKCCGNTYCRSCVLKMKRRCPTCGKLMK